LPASVSLAAPAKQGLTHPDEAMAIAAPQPKAGILEIDAYVPGESKLPAG
jgi:hypothetical protein